VWKSESPTVKLDLVLNVEKDSELGSFASIENETSLRRRFVAFHQAKYREIEEKTSYTKESS
jgi:hypothetical protein